MYMYSPCLQLFNAICERLQLCSLHGMRTLSRCFPLRMRRGVICLQLCNQRYPVL